MSSPRPNPQLFVVGCPRSGTTLLQRMLDSHSMLAVANDTSFIHKPLKCCVPDFKQALRKQGDVPLTSEIVEFTRNYKRFQRLGLNDVQIDRAAKASTYRGFVTALYDEFAAMSGKPIAGEKTPDFVRRIPLLHQLYPQSKFVHIIRDGRDVALSSVEWAGKGIGPSKFELFEQHPVATTAMWWCWQVASGRKDGATLPKGLYHEVRYEHLVDEPDEALRGITDFLGIPYEPKMARYHEGKASYEPSASAKSAWLPVTKGLRDWQAQMSPRDLQVFEALAGDLLDALGYPRAAVAMAGDVAGEVEHCRRWWHSSEARD
jgi:hypothetical protein